MFVSSSDNHTHLTRYYNTDNINKYYDGAKAMLVDSWKVAVPGPDPQHEVIHTGDPNR